MDDEMRINQDYSSFEVYELMHELRIGEINAVDRKFLCRQLDINDRYLRQIIRQAREVDEIPILSIGKGYFIAANEYELVRAKNREWKRALSCLTFARMLSNCLKKLRRMDNGQLGLWSDPEDQWLQVIENIKMEINEDE